MNHGYDDEYADYDSEEEFYRRRRQYYDSDDDIYGFGEHFDDEDRYYEDDIMGMGVYCGGMAYELSKVNPWEFNNQDVHTYRFKNGAGAPITSRVGGVGPKSVLMKAAPLKKLAVTAAQQQNSLVSLLSVDFPVQVCTCTVHMLHTSSGPVAW